MCLQRFLEVLFKATIFLILFIDIIQPTGLLHRHQQYQRSTESGLTDVETVAEYHHHQQQQQQQQELFHLQSKRDSTMMDFKMPTHEETEEKIRFWSERIVGKTLVDDLSENNDTRVVEAHHPSPPRDEKDSSACDEGEKKEQENQEQAEPKEKEQEKEEEQAGPEKQEQDESEKQEQDEPEEQEEEKADAVDDDSNVVLISSLPTPVRVIKPGSRVTRDLRPHRMNVICNKEGLITNVKFY